MTQVELAKEFGVSRITIQTWDREGLADFARISSKPVAYDAAKAWRWRWENKREQPTSQKDAKARKLVAEAAVKELELEERRRELVPVAVLRQTVTDLAVRLRAKIVAFKGSLAPRLTGLDSPRDVSAVLGPAFDELIEELRAVGDEMEGEDAAA